MLFCKRRKLDLFGIGGFELFIILLFGFLIFGPDKLPEMAKTLGAALRKFKQAQSEMESVIKGEILDSVETQGKKASSVSSVSSKSKPAPTATQESFAERKARYDKQRAERKVQQAQDSKTDSDFSASSAKTTIEENRRAMKDEAVKKAHEPGAKTHESSASLSQKPVPSSMASSSTSSTASGQKPVPSGTSSLNSTASSSQKPALTPEELFGTKPIQHKPAPAQAATASTYSSKTAQSAVSERGE